MANEIDDAAVSRDHTVMRPRGAAVARPAAAPRVEGPAGRRPMPAAPAPVQAPPPALADFLGTGLNPLIQAATPLLLLAARIRDMIDPPDVEALREQTAREVRAFEQRAQGAGVASDAVLTARYLLCTMVDEAVLNTPWGSHSAWASRTLLVVFHRESWGGEKFFQILDRALGDPGRHINLLELIYACLSLGFAGKYQVEDRGASTLEDIRRKLYRTIAATRGAPEPELSPHWRGITDRRNPIVRHVPLWVVGSVGALVLLTAFAWFYARLGARAEPIAGALAQFGLEPVAIASVPPPAPVAGRKTLKQLLADQEAAGQLEVEELPDRSIVRLKGQQFASGSASMNRELAQRLAAIAVALQQLPGRVLVVGHTDDQALRSLKFANNHELSAARAKEVARILQETLGAAAAIDTVGQGSDQPHCTPPSTPESRACNRRVEIVQFS